MINKTLLGADCFGFDGLLGLVLFLGAVCVQGQFSLTFVDNDRIVIQHSLGGDTTRTIKRVSGGGGEKDFVGVASPITDSGLIKGETYEYQLFVFDEDLGTFVGSGGRQSATAGEVRGTLPEDLTWTENRTLADDVIVPQGLTLTIRGGSPDQHTVIESGSSAGTHFLNFQGMVDAENVTFKSSHQLNSPLTLTGRFSIPTKAQDITSMLRLVNVNLVHVRVDAANNPVLENVSDTAMGGQAMRLFNLSDYTLTGLKNLTHTSLEFHWIGGGLTIRDSVFSDVLVTPAKFSSQTSPPAIDGFVVFEGNRLSSERSLTNHFLDFGAEAELDIKNNGKMAGGDSYQLEIERIAPAGASLPIRAISGNSGVSNIFLEQVNDAEVSQNTIETPQNITTAGISLNGNNNVIFNNTVDKEFDLFASEFSAGIHVNGQPATGNVIQGNTITEYGSGILLANATDNTIRDNIIDGNSNGIFLNGSGQQIPTNNLIFNNLLRNSTFSNVRLGGDCATGCANEWNIAKTSGLNIHFRPNLGGNFYDDFLAASDTDFPIDFLSNVPRVFNQVNVDGLPLMPPRADLQISLIDPPTEVVPGGLLVVQFEVRNQGPFGVPDPIALDIFPSNFATDQSASPLAPSAEADFCSVNLTVINCNLVNGLESGESKKGTIAYRISDTVQNVVGADGLKFGFFIFSNTKVGDPDSTNNGITLQIQVVDDPDGDGLSSALEELVAAALGTTDINSNGIADHLDNAAALFFDQAGKPIGLHLVGNAATFSKVTPKSFNFVVPPAQFDYIGGETLGLLDFNVNFPSGSTDPTTSLKYVFDSGVSSQNSEGALLQQGGQSVFVAATEAEPGSVTIPLADGGAGDSGGGGDDVIEVLDLAPARGLKANIAIKGPGVAPGARPVLDGRPYIGAFSGLSPLDVSFEVINNGEIAAQNVRVKIDFINHAGGMIELPVASKIDGSLEGALLEDLSWKVPALEEGQSAFLTFPMVGSYLCACGEVFLDATASTTTAETTTADNGYKARVAVGSVPTIDLPQIAPLGMAKTLEDQAVDLKFSVQVSDPNAQLDQYHISPVLDNPQSSPALRQIGTSKVEADPSNPDLLNVMVTVAPELNQFGSRNLDFLVRSPRTGGGFKDQHARFLMEVVPVNDPPSINAPTTLNADEDESFDIPFMINDVDDEPGELTVAVDSRDESKVRDSDAKITGTGLQRTLSLVPVQNANGPVTLELLAGDGNGVQTVHEIVLNLLPINDLPILDQLPEPTIVLNEDQLKILPFLLEDPDSDELDLSVTVSSDNANLLKTEKIQVTGVGKNRQLRLEPESNANGDGTITFNLGDLSGKINIIKRPIRIVPVDDDATITVDLDPLASPEDTEFRATFQVDDIDTPLDQLQVRARSNDKELIPDESLRVEGTGPNRTLVGQPAPGRTGTATVDIEVVNFPSLKVTKRPLTVNIFTPNRAPTITAPSEATTDEDKEIEIPFTISDVDDSPDDLTVAVGTQDPSKVSQAGLSILGSGSDRVLKVIPEPNVHGPVTLELRSGDGKGTLTKHGIRLEIRSINDLPIWSAPARLESPEDTPASLRFTVDDVDEPSLDNLAIALMAGPNGADIVAINEAKLEHQGNEVILRYTPKEHAHGPVEFTLLATDSEGGVGEITRTMEVISVIDKPTFEVPERFISNEDERGIGGVEIILTGEDLFGKDASVTARIPVENHHLIDPTNLTVERNELQVNLSYLPQPNAFGTTPITFELIDAGEIIAAATSMIEIKGENDPPIARLDSFSVPANSSNNVLNVLGNDTSGPNETEVLIIEGINEQPQIGQAVVSPSGELLYTPTPGFAGRDQFKYEIADSGGGRAFATVKITVIGEVDIPDPQFAAAIRDRVGLPPESRLDAGDFLRLGEVLDLSNLGIANLEGIQHATSVKNLNVSGNVLRSFVPVENPWPNLAQINLAENFANINPGTDNARVIESLVGRGIDVVAKKQKQEIDFNEILDRLVCDPFPAFEATGGPSGNPVEFTVVQPFAIDYFDDVANLTFPLTVQVQADQAGNADYLDAVPFVRSFVISKQGQSVVFGPLAPQTVGDPEIVLQATGGGSGQPITFTSSNPSVGAIIDNQLVITGAGTTTVTAQQAGNECFDPAPPVQQQFVVLKGNQSIGINPIPNKVFQRGLSFQILFNQGPSTSPFVLTASPPGILSIGATSFFGIGGVLSADVTVTGVGNVTLTASQNGDANFNDAPNVSTTFNVFKGTQVIAFEEISDKINGDPPFAVSVSGGNSNQPLELKALTPDLISIDQRVVTIKAPGIARIEASQQAGPLHEAALPIIREFRIGAKPTISEIADQESLEDGVLGPIGFVVNDLETAADQLQVQATVVTGPLDASSVSLTRQEGGNHSLTLTPPRDLSGSAEVKIDVTDGSGAKSTSQFSWSVMPVNDSPTLKLNSNNPPFLVAFDDKDNPLDELVFSVSTVPPAPNLFKVIATSPGERRIEVDSSHAPPGQVSFSFELSDADGGRATEQASTQFASFRVVDGYVAGSTVFADLNGNGSLDVGEPEGMTDDVGAVVLPLPSGFSGNIIAIGGTDISTGVPLGGQLKAPANASVVSPVSSVVAELIERGQSVQQAEQVVKEALGVSADVDLLNTDPIAAVQAGDSRASAVLEAVVQVQNLIVQASSVVGGAGSGNSSVSVGDQVVSAIASKIDNGANVDLSNAGTVASVLEETVVASGTAVEEGVLNGAAAVIAAANVGIATAIEDGDGSGFQTLVDVAQIQKVAFTETAAGLSDASAGRESIARVVESFTGAGLEEQVASVVVSSPTGNEPPTVSSIPDQTIPEDSRITGLVVQIADEESDAAQLIVSATSSNPSLISDEGIVIRGAGEERRLELQPRTNSFGETQITLSVDDGQLTVSRSFRVVVEPVNDAPTISEITDLKLTVGEVETVMFEVFDPDDPASDLSVVVTSQDRELVIAQDVENRGELHLYEVDLVSNSRVGGVTHVVVGVSDGKAVGTNSFEVAVDAEPHSAQLRIVREGDVLRISWDTLGHLESARSIIGPFQPVAGVSSPFFFQLPQQGMRYFRVVEP